MMKSTLRRLADRVGMDSVQLCSADLEGILTNSDSIVNYEAGLYLAECVPNRQLTLGDFRILGVKELREENLELMPGYLVSPLGFICIASTAGGDAFAVDCETGKVYLLSHDKYNEGTISPGWNENHSGFLPDIPINRENIIATADREYDDIREFLDFLDQRE